MIRYEWRVFLALGRVKDQDKKKMVLSSNYNYFTSSGIPSASEYPGCCWHSVRDIYYYAHRMGQAGVMNLGRKTRPKNLLRLKVI